MSGRDMTDFLDEQTRRWFQAGGWSTELNLDKVRKWHRKDTEGLGIESNEGMLVHDRALLLAEIDRLRGEIARGESDV